MTTYCHFCNLPFSEAPQMFAGPHCYICSNCVIEIYESKLEPKSRSTSGMNRIIATGEEASYLAKQFRNQVAEKKPKTKKK
jgi:hypothetical protein